MRLSSIGAIGMAMIAVHATATADPPTTPAPAEMRSGLPVSHAPPGEMAATVAPRHRPAVVEHYVDLNSASRQELMTLPGIGAAEAGRIIANRPYLTKTDLVAKNVLPVGPFLSLRHLVVAMPATVSKGRH
jgi:competence protein ComEA